MFAVALSMAGCGGDSSSAREVAMRYVDAVKAQDWSAACAVSAWEGPENCASILQEVYSNPGSAPPTVERTMDVVEEVDGRKVVHFEYTLIR